jgi:predicted dehydrogenase
VSFDQLERLCAAMAAARGKVVLGFNRPHSPFGQALRDVLATQTGSTMLNWFVVGHKIPPDHWYFDPKEGGRVPGNLCHWTDFIYHCIEPDKRYPITITPTPGSITSSDIAISFTFGDSSMAAITFSAKGYTFEGVREKLGAHRGDVIANLKDFHELTIETGAHKKRLRSRFREHGHARAILSFYDAVRQPNANIRTASLAYVWETGDLYLKTRQALEENRQIVVQPHFSAKA